MDVCQICGSEQFSLWACARDEEYASIHDEFSFFQCKDCGVVRIDPVPVARLSEIYPARYYSYGAEISSVIWRLKTHLDQALLSRVLADIEGDKLSVLDIGGGSGGMLDVSRDADSRVGKTTVIDLSPELKTAAEAAGHNYVCSRVEDYETNERYDLVMMFNLIEHIDAPKRCLERIRGMLKPGGRILVKTPNIESLDAHLFRKSYWGGLHAPRHWTLFNRRSFLWMVMGTGLRVCTFRYTQGGAFWAYSILAVMSRFGFCHFSPAKPMVRHPLFGPLAGGFALFDMIRMPMGKPSQFIAVLETT